MPARIEVSARAEVLGISVGPFPGSHLFTTRLIYLSLPRSNGERSIGWGSPPATPVPAATDRANSLTGRRPTKLGVELPV